MQINNIPDKNKINSLINSSKTYIQECLSFWAKTGYDTERGGYYEAVNFEGQPVTDLNRRFRIHPRNIFSHAMGTVRGYGEFTKPAEQAFTFIMSRCWQKNRGFATLTSNSGKIVDDRVFTYDHAFVFLALAWLFYCTGKETYKKILDQIWGIFNVKFRHSLKGFITSDPVPRSEPLILQNPHMHFFEAFLELYVLLKDEYWLAEAKKIYTLYCESFYSSSHRVIIEFFNNDFSPDSLNWNLVEPGHHFEWVWLLSKYERLSHETAISIPEIYDFAIQLGRNSAGLPYEVCAPDGTPIKSTQRMWAQTEQLKADLAMYERTQELGYLKSALLSLENLLNFFCSHRISGVWFDCLDENSRVVSTNSPSSTLYHLLIALDEFIRVVSSAPIYIK